MGFRFRKSKKIGPFRINLSKSGVGWSVGGKGFRYTKRADGKTQKTYSIPGTGISYVEVDKNKNKKKDKSFEKINDSSIIDNMDNTKDTSNNYNEPPKKKNKAKIIAIILYLIIFSKFTKFTGFITLIGGLAFTYNLYAKNEKFKARSIGRKTLTGILLAMFILVFGLGGLNYDSQKNNELQAEKAKIEQQKIDDEKKAEKEKLLAEQKAKEEEAKKKADEEAKLKAEQEAKLKTEEEARKKAEEEKNKQAAAVAAAASVSSKQNNNNNLSSSSGTQAEEGKVVITVTGKKYHYPSCSTVKQIKAYVTPSEAQNMGYEPCGRCHPPR